MKAINTLMYATALMSNAFMFNPPEPHNEKNSPWISNKSSLKVHGKKFKHRNSKKGNKK